MDVRWSLICRAAWVKHVQCLVLVLTDKKDHEKTLRRAEAVMAQHCHSFISHFILGRRQYAWSLVFTLNSQLWNETSLNDAIRTWFPRWRGDTSLFRVIAATVCKFRTQGNADTSRVASVCRSASGRRRKSAASVSPYCGWSRRAPWRQGSPARKPINYKITCTTSNQTTTKITQ